MRACVYVCERVCVCVEHHNLAHTHTHTYTHQHHRLAYTLPYPEITTLHIRTHTRTRTHTHTHTLLAKPRPFRTKTCCVLSARTQRKGRRKAAERMDARATETAPLLCPLFRASMSNRDDAMSNRDGALCTLMTTHQKCSTVTHDG